MLGAGQGSEIEIIGDGNDAGEAIAALVVLVGSGFGEAD